MPAPKKLDTQTETQVVAMLARGDSHPVIVNWLKTDRDITLSVKTISLIKSRNAEALKFMHGEIVKHETTMATTILGKSRRLIDKKLDRAVKLEDELTELRQQYESKEITAEEYYHWVDLALKSQLSVQELNSLAKESFNQSQIEAGKPTSIADSPAQAKASLEALLHAIANNDQSAMMKEIFPNA